MSHFTVLVMITEDEYNNNEDNTLEQRLAPFDENLEVSPYMKKCWCVGCIAKQEARESAIQQVGTIQMLRNSFQPVEGKKENQAAWEAHIAPYIAIETEVLENHPLKDMPATDCEDCNGTGEYLSQYNPQSKWDWYQVGGRWDSALASNCKALSGNVARAGDVCGKYRPFAIITPDGQWHEKGRMGWWAIVTDENENWPMEVDALLTEYEDHICILVDCHI
jgi:hypothetical protein